LLSAVIFPHTVGMINDDNNASKKLSYFQFNRLFIKQFLFKQLEYLSTKLFTKIIVNSNFLKSYLIEEYGVKEQNIFLLYKGIEEIKPRQYKTIDSRNTINVLFVKADFRRGGLSVLVEALAQLPYQFTLTIIGPPDNSFAEIKLMEKNRDNVKLHILGVQPQVIVKKELRETDIFCVPSLKEALGVANLEAIAMGVPVVTTNVGGIPEIMDYGKNGWLVPANNPDALSEALMQCISNKNERKLKIEAGILFSRRFSIENSIENLLKILEK